MERINNVNVCQTLQHGAMERILVVYILPALHQKVNQMKY